MQRCLMSLKGWVTEWVCGLQASLSTDSLSKKLQTYKIISHQILCFVIFSCDAGFHHQGLYVFIHVHPLDCLFGLSLALEVAEVHVIIFTREFSAYIWAGWRSGNLTCMMVCPKLDMWRLYLFKRLNRTSIRCFSISCMIWKKQKMALWGFLYNIPVTYCWMIVT